MFNQTKLELIPSIRVAGILAIPCFASLILILLAELPISLSVLLLLLHSYISLRLIRRYALLSSPDAITSIDIRPDAVYLEDKSGNRYEANILPKSIIFPAFTLLSFRCNQITERQCPQHQQTNSDLSSTFIFSRLTSLSSCFRSSYLFFVSHISSSPRRHLFICRYNAPNLKAFRRIRVWFRFS